MKHLALALAALSLSLTAVAETKEIVGLSADDYTPSLASVEKSELLIRSQKGDSVLRVSLLVTDNGGSTDVSPLSELYLTTFNESEMRGAESIHLISHINQLVSYQRLNPGVYEVVVRLYDYDSTCASWNGQIEGLKKFTIDARQLTADVRSFKNLDDFDHGVIQTPITVQSSCL